MDSFEKLLCVTRETSSPFLYFILFQCSEKDIEKTIMYVFYLRSYIFGKGERLISKKSYRWLFINYTREFMKYIKLIPIVGRWDDLLYMFPNVFELSSLENLKLEYCSNITKNNFNRLIIEQNKIVDFFCNKLEEDKVKMDCGQKVSLISKWSPTETSSYSKKYKLVKIIIENLNINYHTYRVKFITPLRKYIEKEENIEEKVKNKEINYIYEIKKTINTGLLIGISTFNIKPHKTIFLLDTSPSMKTILKSYNISIINLAIIFIYIMNQKNLSYPNNILNYDNKPILYDFRYNCVSKMLREISQMEWNNELSLNNYNNIENRIFIITDKEYNIKTDKNIIFWKIEDKLPTMQKKNNSFIFKGVSNELIDNFFTNKLDFNLYDIIKRKIQL